MIRMIRTLLGITVASVFITQAAQSWYSLGLSDRAVNRIIADDTSTIIAGTDSGISVLFNSKWYHIKMLPVTAIVRVSPTAVAAAAGNGSKSDGVYIGKSIINGPPFYSFTLGDWIMNPTALAAGPAVSPTISATDPPVVLYVGNKNSVAGGLISKDSLSKLASIPMPLYTFGVEDPFCAGLHIFNNRLYAGGYDRSPAAGSSCLLYYFGDSLYSMRRMKTTAIAEGQFFSLRGSGSLVMVAADADSGVFFYDQLAGEPWHRIAGPTNAPIRSLYVRQASPSTNDNTLYAANNDGVFQCMSGGVPQPFWVKLGTLPAEPLFITGVGSAGDLLAATVKGVFRYGEQVSGVSAAPRPALGKKTQIKRTVCVSVNNSLPMGNGRYNLQGRSMVSKADAGAKASGVVVTDVR